MINNIRSECFVRFNEQDSSQSESYLLKWMHKYLNFGIFPLLTCDWHHHGHIVHLLQGYQVDVWNISPFFPRAPSTIVLSYFVWKGHTSHYHLHLLNLLADFAGKHAWLPKQLSLYPCQLWSGKAKLNHKIIIYITLFNRNCSPAMQAITNSVWMTVIEVGQGVLDVLWKFGY